MKAVVHTKLGEGGRIIIPVAFRQNLDLVPGDDVILHLENNTIFITTSDQALNKIQAKVKNYIQATGKNISLVDELIALRRAEVDHD